LCSRLILLSPLVALPISILLTAAGRAYFCYCEDEEREALLVLLRRDPVQAVLANDDRFIANLLEQTRSRGYSSNEGDWSAERKRSEEHTSELQSRENIVC